MNQWFQSRRLRRQPGPGRAANCLTLRCALVLALVLGAGCGEQGSAGSQSAAAPAVAAEPAYYSYEVVNVYPHDVGAFTEGLVYLDGELLESTGLNGRSSLRRVELKTGKVLQQVSLPFEYFGEGMTVLNGKVYQLTYQTQKGFVYDLKTFAKEKEFSYSGEGWGLTTDGKSLIMTDGTYQIRFMDPQTFKVTKTISVFNHGIPLKNLNELEYVKGELYANVWQTDYIVRINPANGDLLGIVDMRGLLPLTERSIGTDVFNGIAYDAAGDRLFVTGKDWPKLFEVKFKAKQ